MKTFAFIRPPDPAAAMAAQAESPTAQQGASVRFLAGGTTLVDLMKLNVEIPQRVVDINRLPLDRIESLPDGGLKIGATVPQLPGISCNAPAAFISAILRCPVTSASPAAAAPPSRATIGT
jgi:CO/xanthine dehydrogenase FAD-binding subunit